MTIHDNTLRIVIGTKTVEDRKSNFKVAGLIRKGIFSFVAFEVTAAALGFAAFRTLRRSEEKRKYLYVNWPNLASTYYWVEDSISFGQLTGTRLRLSDQRRWAQIDPQSENIETD